MTRSIFGHKSITHLIYGLLMMLPFFAIGVKCIYVQANPNAKDSYSSNNNLTLVESFDELHVNSRYRFELKDYQFTNDNSKRIYFSNLSDYTNTYNSFSYDSAKDCDSFTLTYYSPYSYCVFYKNNVQQSAIRTNISFSFELLSVSYNSSYSYLDEFDSTLSIYNDYKSLDNVFDYSISQVIDENNGFVPKNDFVGLLNGVFSDSSDHLYLKLTNWYLNYALLISTIYIFFLAILWFVNLCRNILERSMNIGNGVD